MGSATEGMQIPSETEMQLSRASSQFLASHLPLRTGACRLRLVSDDIPGEEIEIPASALHLLIDVLAQMAQGNAVTLMPIQAELTTQEAADLLQVSRPHLVKLLETGQIPFHRVGRHRRVRLQELMAYKQQIDTARSQVLDELVAQAETLGMGY